MRVALVYPPYGAASNQPNIKAVADNYGVFPPLSLAYVAGVLKKSSHEVILIDANALELDVDDTIKKLEDFSPDVIAYTITTYLFHSTLDWIKAIRSKIDVPVIVGGVHTGLYPNETLSYDAIDYLVIGEAESTLPEFLNFLEKKKDISKVRGIAYRDGKKVKITKERPFVQDLDKVPYPARELLPNDRYYSFISQKKNFTALISSRGCPFRCVYCEQGGLKFRARSPKDVVDEMQHCIENFLVKEIDIFDSSFTVDRKRVLGICKEIKRRALDISWSVRSRVDLVDEELLNEMKSAGCIRIYYGIESGNSEVLKTLKKETDLEKIKKTIKDTRKSGITAFGYFMIGNPGDSEETIKQTINFAKKLDLDFAQFSKVSTLPGTKLYEWLLPTLEKDYWREYILDRDLEMDLPRFNCSLSEEDIQYWVKKAYRSFYFRPSFIIRKLFSIRSPHECLKYAKAAIGMLFNR